MLYADRLSGEVFEESIDSGILSNLPFVYYINRTSRQGWRRYALIKYPAV